VRGACKPSGGGATRSLLTLLLGLNVAWTSAAHAATVGPEPEAADPTAAPGAEAAPVGDDASETPDEPKNEVREEAIALYRAGASLYSAADYVGAIDKFTQALALTSGGEASFDADTRGLLLFNLATAHDRAYNVDADVTHLRQAKELLERIVREGAAHGYSAALVDQSSEALERVTARLDEIEAAQAKEEAAKAEADRQAKAEAEAREADRPDPNAGRGLIIGGAAMTGLGVASSAIWIAGVAIGSRATGEVEDSVLPSDEEARIESIGSGKTANTLVVAGAVVSGVLVTTGVALLVVGLKKRKNARSRLACAPSVSPGGIFVGCGVRL